MKKLSGCAFVTQIVDHAVNEEKRLFLILMELGACDLHFFFRKFSDELSMPGVCRIWQTLVRAVDAAHEQGIIHCDIKPQNFLLVPVTPFADKILATTAVPREKFVFRMVDEDDDRSFGSGSNSSSTIAEDRGDVKLFLRDPSTGTEQILRLCVKLTDFGLSQPLEVDASHLSIKGCFGTILYMAPETLRPAELGGTTKKVATGVDVWALGVILFQMLHDNRTPFGAYQRTDGYIGVAVAASNKEIHQKATVLERSKVWIAERKNILLKVAPEAAANRQWRKRKDAGNRQTDGDDEETAIGHALLETWLQTEFLFHVCEFCLAFEASDRVCAKDLARWIGTAFEKNWWREELCGAAGRYAHPQARDKGLKIVGRIIAEAALPEVFARHLRSGNDVATGPLRPPPTAATLNTLSSQAIDDDDLQKVASRKICERVVQPQGLDHSSRQEETVRPAEIDRAPTPSSGGGTCGDEDSDCGDEEDRGTETVPLLAKDDVGTAKDDVGTRTVCAQGIAARGAAAPAKPKQWPQTGEQRLSSQQPSGESSRRPLRPTVRGVDRNRCLLMTLLLFGAALVVGSVVGYTIGAYLKHQSSRPQPPAQQPPGFLEPVPSSSRPSSSSAVSADDTNNSGPSDSKPRSDGPVAGVSAGGGAGGGGAAGRTAGGGGAGAHQVSTPPPQSTVTTSPSPKNIGADQGHTDTSWVASKGPAGDTSSKGPDHTDPVPGILTAKQFGALWTDIHTQRYDTAPVDRHTNAAKQLGAPWTDKPSAPWTDIPSSAWTPRCDAGLLSPQRYSYTRPDTPGVWLRRGTALIKHALPDWQPQPGRPWPTGSDRKRFPHSCWTEQSPWSDGELFIDE